MSSLWKRPDDLLLLRQGLLPVEVQRLEEPLVGNTRLQDLYEFQYYGRVSGRDFPLRIVLAPCVGGVGSSRAEKPRISMLSKCSRIVPICRTDNIRAVFLTSVWCFSRGYDASRGAPAGVGSRTAYGKKTLLRQRRLQVCVYMSRPVRARVRGASNRPSRREPMSAADVSSRITRSRWCYPPQAGHCQDPAPLPEQPVAGGRANCRHGWKEWLDVRWSVRGYRWFYRCWCAFWSLGAGAVIDRRYVISNAMSLPFNQQQGGGEGE